MQRLYAGDFRRFDSLSAAAPMTISEFQNGHFIPPPSTQIGDPEMELFSSSTQDDFVDQILSSVPSNVWPDLSPTKSIALPSHVHGPPPITGSINFDYDMPSPKQGQSHIAPNDLSFLTNPSPTVHRHYQQQQHQIAISMGDNNVFSAADNFQRPLKGTTSGGDWCTYDMGRDCGVQPLYEDIRASQHCGWQDQASSPAYGLHDIQAHSGGAVAAKPSQRVRARRGQATDPHSIAERLRRERITERMKALQELVPNANKTDKASMLDEIIEHVKFLQLQVKVLSISRLGGGGATVASHSPPLTTASQGSEEEDVAAAEKQMAKLMEEDMGRAMQYLQGKGLYLMPISLATTISATTTSTSNPLLLHSPVSDDPSSPTLSVLTTQSAAADVSHGTPTLSPPHHNNPST